MKIVFRRGSGPVGRAALAGTSSVLAAVALAGLLGSGCSRTPPADPCPALDRKLLLQSKTTDATSAIRKIYEAAVQYYEKERAAQDGGTRRGEPEAPSRSE
jgi:hypothetical protein